MVPGTILSEIQQHRIVTQDGSTLAFVCWFANGILQRRQIAYDGQKWFYQSNTRAYFEEVSESAVFPPLKEAFAKFMEERQKQRAIGPDRTTTRANGWQFTVKTL